MNSDLNLPPKDVEPLTHSTQPPTETPSPYINRPESNQQNDQHASQPESVASASQYFAPIQAEFVAECKHYEQHLRQDCDEFASIQKQIIESSDALADKLLTKRKLQQQLNQAKKDKAAQIESKLETLGQQLQDHFREYAQLRVQHGMQRAEEYHEQHILPLQLQRDQWTKDIERLESTDQQLININQEVDKNSKSIEELEKTLQKFMRDLRLKAGGSYLDNVNRVLALKAEIANLNQVILKMHDEQRDELIQRDANIAAVREDMEGQMKKQAEQFTVQTKELGDEMNAKIIGIRDEMKQQSDQFRAQLQAQLLSSVTPNSTEELLHLITAPQGSLMLVSLTSLDLSKCKLGDKKADFFKALFKMPNLAYLSLCGNDIGDDGVQALAISITSTKLTSLDLRSNNIGEAGAEALAASKTLTNLTSLNLVDNYIADAGAEALATSTTLTNLTSLDLRHNYIEPPGAQAMRTRYPFISV